MSVSRRRPWMLCVESGFFALEKKSFETERVSLCLLDCGVLPGVLSWRADALLARARIVMDAGANVFKLQEGYG